MTFSIHWHGPRTMDNPNRPAGYGWYVLNDEDGTIVDYSMTADAAKQALEELGQ